MNSIAENEARFKSAAGRIRATVEALELIAEPGQLVELRILGVEGNDRRVDSGYFTDWAKLGKAASSYHNRARGIYITLNPVNPDLLARAANRVETWAKATTADVDIVCRRWLPIDVDPVRPAGISANEAEHAAALERTREIRAWLTARGWPEPIYADSGNGGHLLYRVDLDNDEAGKALIENVLKALAAQFTDDALTVDTKVGNAARIWKLYGTQARKGDSTADRPHRWAQILEAPDAN